MTTSWTDTLGGDWSDPLNWDNGVPGVDDSALVELPGNYTVTVDTVAEVEYLKLGDGVGTQTLAVENHLTSGAYGQIAIFIRTGAVMDATTPGAEITCVGGFAVAYSIRNEGTLNVSGTTIHCGGETLLSYGEITLTGGGIIEGGNDVWNYGLIVADSGAISTQLWSFGSGDGVSVTGYLSVQDVVNDNVFEIEYGATLQLMDPGNGAEFVNNDNNSVLLMRGGSSITGGGFGDAALRNLTTVLVDADTSLENDEATIAVYTINDSQEVPSEFRLSSGNLSITDSCSLGDTVYVAEGCTLRVNHAEIEHVTGGGTIHFTGGTNRLHGDWPFTGGLLLTGSVGDPDSVLFDETGSSNLDINSLRLMTPFTNFLIGSDDDVVVDTVEQGGGTIRGATQLNDTYEWTQGTYSSNTAGDLNIPAGVSLSVSGGGAKVLDSLQLNIEGSAVMQDSGVFTLVDSAVVNVAPTGTLAIDAGFTMDGVGHFYNSGETSIDPAGDTVSILVPIYNSTVARTPGTIDILSAPVIFGADGHNESGLNLATLSLLILNGKLINADGGVIRIPDGAEVVVNDTLQNDSLGEIDMGGGAVLSGAGVVQNEGDMYGGGTLVLTTTNIEFHADLLNLDSGFVNVLQDTLTIYGDATNQGRITIQSGAVLKILGNFLNDVSGIIDGNGALDVSEAVSFVNNGTISPGLSPGLMTVNGDLILDVGSQLQIELGGATPQLYDRLQVTGRVYLEGMLNLSLQNGFVPSLTDTMYLMSYDSAENKFARITGTDIGNGQFLEIAVGIDGIKNYVCSGVADIALDLYSFQDTIVQTESNRDTFTVLVENTGHCPLQYVVNDGLPPWVTIFPGDDSGLLARTENKQIRMCVDATALSEGDHNATMNLLHNDPDAGSIIVNLQIHMIHGPHVWDVGGGNQDFVNFTQAADFLNGGVIAHPQIFNVYPGTYTESVTIGSNAGSSALNTITFRPAIDETRPILQSSAPVTLRLFGADHVTVDGLEIRRTAGGPGVAILDTAGADHNVFQNLTVSGSDSGSSTNYGILISSATLPSLTNDSIRISDVYVHGFNTGIGFGRLVSFSGGSARQNELSGSLIENCVTGVFIKWQTQLRVHDLSIMPGYPSAAVSSITGIDVHRLSVNDTVRIYNNLLADFRAQGTAHGIITRTNEENSYVLIFNNLIGNFGGVVGNSNGISINERTRAGIYFNTVRMSENTAPGLTTITAVSMDGGQTNVDLRNNILVSEATSDSSTSISRLNAVFSSDRNCFWGTGTRYRVGRNGVTNYPTLTQWQSAMVQDANSIQDLPGFADVTNAHIDGYWHTCDSRALAVDGITVDFDGQARHATTPDIGADEFTGIYDKIDSLVARRMPASPNLRLNWEPIAGAQSYVIYAGTTPDFTMSGVEPLGTSAANLYIDTRDIAARGLKQFYLVRPSTLPPTP